MLFLESKNQSRHCTETATVTVTVTETATHLVLCPRFANSPPPLYSFAMSPVFHSEIQNRIQNGYLDRLGPRVRRMRLLYTHREWDLLRLECVHLRDSAPRFGFTDMGILASEAESSLRVMKRLFPLDRTDSRKSIENLFTAIDHILTKR